MHCCLFSDLDLILAYHCCERSSEVSKQVLDLNFTLRTIFPFLHNRNIDKGLEAAFHTWLVVVLKNWVLSFHEFKMYFISHTCSNPTVNRNNLQFKYFPIDRLTMHAITDNHLNFMVNHHI